LMTNTGNAFFLQCRSTMGRHSSRSAKRQDLRTDDSPLIPSVNERLAFLRPSRELLEYYRKKIAEFDEEHETLLKRLENYKATYEEQVGLDKHGETVEVTNHSPLAL
ncbi:hypothetical protein scyTo_0022642, partial [Scyliorhinus torazame]|nr:hypothetical protein [Scyliorhinus torazame]